MLQTDSNSLSQEEKDILETVKKINVVAFPLNGENDAQYEGKRQELKDIISQEKYKTLKEGKTEE